MNRLLSIEMMPPPIVISKLVNPCRAGSIEKLISVLIKNRIELTPEPKMPAIDFIMAEITVTLPNKIPLIHFTIGSVFELFKELNRVFADINSSGLSVLSANVFSSKENLVATLDKMRSIDIT